jgi:hypothetical protein
MAMERRVTLLSGEKPLLCWIFYTWFVVESCELVDKNCVGVLCGGSAMEDVNKES